VSLHSNHQIAAIESLGVGLCQYNAEEQRALKDCLSKIALSVLASFWLLSVANRNDVGYHTAPRPHPA